jgi:alpha-soluble NSF attachment protein
VAHFAAQLENYNKAIEMFEKVGTASINNNLMKFGAREHFLKAGICFMARGVSKMIWRIPPSSHLGG